MELNWWMFRLMLYLLVCFLPMDQSLYANHVPSNSGLIDDYSYFFYRGLNGLFPIFMSVLFSILAYRNVRGILWRHFPFVRRRVDEQLTAMISVRVVFFCMVIATIYNLLNLFTSVDDLSSQYYPVRYLPMCSSNWYYIDAL